MAFGESWHIKSRTNHCIVSGDAFVDGQTIVAALFPDPESSGWLRRDYRALGPAPRAAVDQVLAGTGCQELLVGL
jgi:hypothetical protein